MADELYRRLSCGQCQIWFLQLAGPGAVAKRCVTCRADKSIYRKTTLVAGARRCITCAKAFDARPNQKHCSVGCRTGIKATRAEQVAAGKRAVCEHCSVRFKPKRGGANKKDGYRARWCSMECRSAAAAAREKKPRSPRPEFSVYFASHCQECGGAGRSHWRFCSACVLARAAASTERMIQARRALNEALHRAAARDFACPDCGVRFCRVFGKHISVCPDCIKERRRSERSARKALIRAVTVEQVNHRKVFERDGWRCYLCGCDTPRRLRGTYEPNAPEVEHVIPLAKDGPHSYANTRCSCRACNQDKGDDLLADYLARRARGETTRSPHSLISV